MYCCDLNMNCLPQAHVLNTWHQSGGAILEGSRNFMMEAGGSSLWVPCLGQKSLVLFSFILLFGFLRQDFMSLTSDYLCNQGWPCPPVLRL